LSQVEARGDLLQRLRKDLLGPYDLEEEIRDRPSDRYLTGILYPQESEIRAEEDDDLRGAEGGDEEAAMGPEGVPLVSTVKPSSAGFSFSLGRNPGRPASVDLIVRCGVYKPFYLDEHGEEIEGTGRRSEQRWRRVQHEVCLRELLESGARSIDLGRHGISGLELYLQVTNWNDSTLTVTAALVNRLRKGDTRTESEERSFFQVELEARPCVGSWLTERPTTQSRIDEDDHIAALIYRDAQEIAVGHTCAAEWGIDGSDSSVRTTWLPLETVPATSASGDSVFRRLAVDEVNPLSAVWLGSASPVDLGNSLDAFVTCYRDWIAVQAAAVSDLERSDHRAQGGRHIEICNGVADRMVSSIRLLQSDNAVRTAFQLAQSAMAKQRKWAYGEDDLLWRPFQLAFQLLVLESLADRGHPDRQVMDLLWFPTGGGKTEAYLGLTAFVLFLRRLRRTAGDNGAGVAVIMRYTLRLLTIQQFQRATSVICACEHLRRLAEKEGRSELGGAAMSVGLWVGNNATPGTLQQARKGGAGEVSTYKQLTGCPCCGGPLQWSLQPGEPRVACAQQRDCEFASESPVLPVWTIDEDIYREGPSLVIGTVDKFVQIVRRPETSIFFGIGAPHAPPDLIIQDELHLISGPLGSMTGLFETTIDELCAHRGARPKVIGSTATIRRAGEQIRSLFNRATAQFPPPGLHASNSCFAVWDTDSPGRCYLGVSTAGRSEKYALQAVAAALLQGAAAVGSEPADRDPFWTLVGYFNTLRALGGSIALMQDDVPAAIEQVAARRGERPRRAGLPAELTSRVGSYQIRDMLDDINRTCDQDGCYDVLLASNMISVGVDIPRLGLMLMVGQPKTIAEYIQATSRVGRGAVPGLVVSLFNNARVRDRSHFESFASWHRTLYRDVEATSVTPFASRAQDKALHAALVALVRHLVPGMAQVPTLGGAQRADAETLADLIVQRAQAVDRAEAANVATRLQQLLAAWESQGAISTYWDDYGRRTSLLMSAEQHAATQQSGSPNARALWPTPNSMREVEPGTPFVLVEGLQPRGAGDGAE